MLRKFIFGLALLASSSAFAQAPPAVPALPDTERRTSYSITGTTCTCAVGFALYGDGTDYGNWLEVWLNGVLQASSTYTITSPTGPLSSIARPITDAVLTFNTSTTGTVQIVGARRPRRTTQFNENQGVAARDLNQALTDIISQNRETWDKTNDVTGRALLSQPGNTLGRLPLPSACQNATLGFDATGLNPICLAAGGVVTTPATLTAGLPIIGNGAQTVVTGTKSGNTTNFATVSGSFTSGHCIGIDGSGNFIDQGGACLTGTKSGNTTVFGTVTGTLTSGHCIAADGSGNIIDQGGACVSSSSGVSAGNINQLAFYAATGSVVSGTSIFPPLVTMPETTSSSNGVLQWIGSHPAETDIFMHTFTPSTAVANELVGNGYHNAYNTFIGFLAGNFSLSGTVNTSNGARNVGIGYQSMKNATSTQQSTCIGFISCLLQTSAFYYTAVGAYALSSSQTGDNNVAVGADSLCGPFTCFNTGSPSTGQANTAIGTYSGQNWTTGSDNILAGFRAGQLLSTGSQNILIGSSAGGQAAVTGNGNVAIGYQVDTKLTTGGSNIAIGPQAMTFNDIGNNNIGIGAQALDVVAGGGNSNIGIGSAAGADITTGLLNTIVGDSTGRGIITGSYNTIIGAGVTGLSSSLTRAIIIADGFPTIRADFNKTNASSWTLTDPITHGGSTFANLPASPVAGMTAYVTDALAANCADSSCTTWGTNVTGGTGALKRLVWYNGTNWTLIGK